jgi:type IV pilus assembly protein PilY1
MHKTSSNFNKIFFSALFSFSISVISSAHAQNNNNIAPINLSNTPLHGSTTTDKPTMALALSVEFPTVGAQYRDTYSSTKEYIGYYYSKGCYIYIDEPTEAPASGKNSADYKRFKFVSESANRQCTGEHFSGNYLNWASSSAIDMLRLALSGGDRYIDENGLTILQRAVLPDGAPSPSCFWNNSAYFPSKKLDPGTDKSYQGAVPASMRTLANLKPIWVANTLNRIYFRSGDNASGSSDCSNTPKNNYTLGKKPTISQVYSQTTRPADTVHCARNGETCSITSPKEVWYGQSNSWKVVATSQSLSCSGSTFGINNKNTDQCYTRDISSITANGLNGFNTEGFFYARAEVCTKSGSTTVDHKDFELCKSYPSSNFKPIGVIQKHADNLRISAFGYLMDQTASHTNGGRYGGVLRSPMKYVGPKTFNIYGKEESASNPLIEWNTQTGVFNENPDLSILPAGQNISNSGVINYLNKFGRMGTTQGMYKQYDPVGELYYQALRYLQGLDPTAEAVSGIDATKLDGFPAYASWSNLDPYKNRSRAENYACLKSNIVVVGDINTHDGNWRTIPNSDTPANNTVNFRNWLTAADDYERNTFSNTEFNKQPDRSQIIGYAYWAHANDIRPSTWTNQPEKQRPGLRVKTFLFDVNENGTETLLANRSKKNQFFLASKYGGYETDPNNIAKAPYSIDHRPDFGITPPATSASTPLKNNAVWQRPSGDASTYYLQSEARGVLTAFEDIFNRASSSAQSIAQSSASTSSITASTDSYIYTATYDTASWTGNISAKKIILDATTKNVTLVEDNTWNPATLLNTKNPNNRNISIGLGNNLGGSKAAISFTWSSIVGTGLEAHFNKASISAAPDNLGSNRVNYLRGVKTDEGNLFRIRSSLMGDIINAGVTYLGKPSNKYADLSYQLFLNANKDRAPMLFTGANDGMLHAFAAETTSNFARGEEVFAYIPSWLGPNLPSLAAKTYIDGNNHQAFVDAPSVVGEAQFTFTAGAGAAADWKSVLVSGTGAGGRGIFALDVTSPSSFGPDKLLWEFTHNDDSDLGYVVGRPKILKFKTGINTYRWFAAVASGTNNYNSAFNSLGGGGAPAIFLLALNKPTHEAWQHGTNYFKISLPLDTALAASMAPGIVDFSTLWASDGTVTHIYAGDLHGNLWKLDFTDANAASQYKTTANWTVDKLSAFKKGAPAQALPLYQATRTINNVTTRQPISAAPLLMAGPVVRGVETFYVLFGTGKYLENSDITSVSKQSFYALFDNGSVSADSTTASRVSAITPGTTRLQQATIDTASKSIKVPSFIWGRPTTNAEALTQRSGWFFDFPETAERMIFSATDLGEFNVSFSSVIPGENQVTPSICTADSASSNVYDINIRTAEGSYRTSQIGILGPSLFLENEEKTSTDDIDSSGRARRTVVREQIMTGTKNTGSTSSSIVEIVGRLSWRQIYNYKELKYKSTPAATSTTTTTTTTTTP